MPVRGLTDTGSLTPAMGLVLFVSYSGALGGAERVLLDFAARVDGERCVACPDGPLAAAARGAGMRVFATPTRRLDLRTTARDRLLAGTRLGAHALEIRRLVTDLDPDLLVPWGMRSALAALAVARGGRGVLLAHHDLLPGAAVGALVRAAARRADKVVVPSRFVALDLDPRGALDGRLEVVHPGVDSARFGAGEAAPAAPAEVLVLGTISRMKRPELALEAIALVRRRWPDVRLRLVGAPVAHDGELLLAELRERAGRPDLAGSVELVGAVDDVRPELARASCVLHCADREPFGIAVLEALAAARPVVVPAAGGPAEIVDSSCAALYPPGDAAAAGEAVLAVLASPERAAAMAARGRARARERFDRSISAERFARTAAVVARRQLHATAPPLTLVTVTHNSAHQLGALLASVQRHLPRAGVVIVDCASTDDTLAVARAAPGTTTVALDENVGFGRACNRGLAEVRAEVTALVNPDVELLDASLRELAVEALRGDRAERLLAPLVLSPDGTRQDTVHPRPLAGTELITALVPPALLPGPAGALLAPWRARTPRRVGWAVGCALLARTATLRRLGPFDERIFLYGEDLELGLRAAAEGIETWFWPRARVLHHGGHASATAFGGEPFDRLAVGRHDVVARHLGPRGAALDAGLQALTFCSRGLAKRALGRSAVRERRQLDALGRVRRA
jgi:GT2 family glycosyltransferase/glycosyltransferase involved in cell wall biosynthesis